MNCGSGSRDRKKQILSEAVSEGRSSDPGDKLALILKENEVSQVSSMNNCVSSWVSSTELSA